MVRPFSDGFNEEATPNNDEELNGDDEDVVELDEDEVENPPSKINLPLYISSYFSLVCFLSL